MKLFAVLSCLLSVSLYSGEISREIYKNINSHGVELITSNPKFPWNPDVLDTVPNFEFGPKYGDNYGARVRGYIAVPEDGDYTFYLATDDNGSLFISLDGSEENKQQICSVQGWTPFRNYNKYASQKSAVFSLSAGQRLYTEAFVKEGGGGDHLSVAWSKNDGPIEVISGDHLSPFVYDLTEQQDLLTNAIQLAQSLHTQSASNIGSEQGQYSEASRVNYSIDIQQAQDTLNAETESGRVIAKALFDLDQATELFTGGIKPTKILGVPFGTSPAYYESRTFEAAHDGNILTYFDYLLNNGAYTGIEVPDGRETAVLGIRYFPRRDLRKRMIGGKFQGSVDGETYVTLHTITEEPSFEWHSVSVSDATAYKYLRYLGPNNSHGNVAELEFLGLQNQDLFMLRHELIPLKANTADQAIEASYVTAEHGGLLPQFIKYRVLELPFRGILKLGTAVLTVDGTFTQKDLNDGALSFSADSSRKNDFFKVEVTDSVGGLLEEVIIDIKIDSDFDGLSDQQEIALGTDYDNADTNGNGIDDAWEHENGLDPVADTLSPLVNEIQGENGLTASYVYGRFSKIADFASRSPAKVAKVKQINFTNSYWQEFANSGTAHNVGAKFSGYIYIPVEGNYKFILSSDDGSKLFIDGIQLITNDGLHSYTQVSGVMNLSAGFHKIRCEYFEAGGNHGCILQWEGPGRVRQVIPSSFFFLSIPEHEAEVKSIDTDQDGLTDELEAIALSDPNNPDSDGDKLLDGEEYHAAYGYKTSPLMVDTDSDTVSDYDEIFVFKSNPLVPDFDGSAVETITLIPKDVINTIGQWQVLYDDIFAISRRGGLEYEYELAQPGIYKLDISAVANILNTKRPYYDLHIYIDDEYVGRQEQTILEDETKDFSFLLPYSSLGKHKLKIYWDNVYENKSLQVISIELKKFGGPDNNSNGRPDWVDSYLENTYSLDLYSPSSKVSPAQIEGKGRFISKLTNSLSLPVKKGTYRRWYIDMDLIQDGPTPFTLDFENGLDSKSGSITWEETNVLEDEDLTVRQGSSMLLNAVIDGDTNPTVSIKVGEDEAVKVLPGEPLEYKFDKPGTYNVVAEYQGLENRTETLVVKVIGVENAEAPFMWRGKERPWSWSGLSNEIVLQAEGMNFSPTASGYNIKRTEVLEDINIIARLGTVGPIIHALETKAFWLRDAVDGYLNVIEKYEDGSIETLGKVFSHKIPEGMDIKVNTISGVTFLDGSRTITITKDDFNEFGEWNLELLRSPDRTGANCHWYKIYQDGVLVGQQNK